MLSRSGKLRTFRDNARLGIALCAVGGFVNSGGLIVLGGTVVSHVTGHWTNLSKAVATSEWAVAGRFGLWCGSFLLGAIFSAFLIETHRNERMRSIYVRPLLFELLFVSLFAAFGTKAAAISPGWQTGVIAFMCFSMGLQNAMLSRLTGGTVRGTHLTGITTDLGIEIVRVAMILQARLANVAAAHGDEYGLRHVLSELREVATQEPAQRMRLFLYMLVSFVVGAMLGTLSFTTWGSEGALPVVALLAVFAVEELFELRREIEIERREAGRAGGLTLGKIVSSANLTLPPPRTLDTTVVAPAPTAAAPADPAPEARTPAP
jgi:uncharacterized membrane protein YoaK (UPF0700 family)